MAAGATATRSSPYQAAYERAARSTQMLQYAPPADVVARTIVSAVESKRPMKRYPVGADAVVAIAANAIVPRTVLDTATRLASGLGGKPGTYL